MRPDVVAARCAWREGQSALDPNKLVFIDETWASTNMTPRYGRCEVGKRLIGYAPFGHWKTTTFVAGLRSDGLTAPCVFDGAINGDKFTAYVEQELVATLRPGDIVIMDNLSSHKRSRPRGDQRRGRRTAVSSALQPRSRSHRTGVRQIQRHPAQARQSHHRKPMERLRHRHSRNHAQRLPELLLNSGYSGGYT